MDSKDSSPLRRNGHGGSSCTQKVFARGLLSLLAACILLLSMDARGTSGETPAIVPETAVGLLPYEYGEIIYRSNEKSPYQLFIIGMSHRDALTLMNGNTTPRAQAEAYKIGEWLVRNEELELLLPEGFFQRKTAKPVNGEIVKAGMERGIRRTEPLDMGTLEKRLSDDRVYVNAEMLLKEDYSMKTEQVEDRKLYEKVGESIHKLSDIKDNPYDYFFLKSELDCLQELRTAAMLQRIPEAVEREFREGGIRSKRALFTIGMNHIHEIIKYLKDRRIAVHAPLFASDSVGKGYAGEVNLLKEGFGVTIIIPRVLADNPEVLKLTRLDKIIAQSRKKHPVVLPVTLQKQ
ncbi:MAG TPA: hypothetical protein VF790_08450 [Dissulfurispiraceae bacterium]